MFRRRTKDVSDPTERLTLPASIEDGRIPGFARSLLYALSGLVLVSAIWLSVGEVRERIVASGSLIPAEAVHIIEHLEGGIVETVQVREGQIVESGTLLMQLRPNASQSDLEQLRIRAAAFELEQIRIDATLAGKKPNFGEVGIAFPGLAADQAKLNSTDRAQIRETRATMEARIARSEAAVNSLAAQKETLQKRLDILSEQASMWEALQKDGFGSRREHLDAQYRVEQAHQELITNEGDFEAARGALDEARSEMAKSDAEFLRRLAEERKNAAKELAEVRQQLAKQTDRVARLEIRAPLDCIVLDLAVGNVGEVVNPGDIVVRVVPVDANIIAEVKVRPQDVAQVQPGQAVEVTVTAFDPNVYGTVAGEVQVVSPSTFEDEQGIPYYKATIGIVPNTAEGLAGSPLLLPGMVVEASIIIGAKSIMRYMLKPVYRSLDRAFTEK